MEEQQDFSTYCGVDPNTHDATVNIKVIVMNTEDGKATTISLHDELEAEKYRINTDGTSQPTYST